MMRTSAIFILIYLLTSKVAFSQTSQEQAIIEDKTYFSEVFNETRHCRIILPPGYYNHPERNYPVIYFFHGFGGRYNGPAKGTPSVSSEARYYDEFNGDYGRTGSDSLDNFAAFVQKNDVIIAKWDGYVASQYPRPYDVGPVKDDIQFIEYFPEFVKYVDNNYQTIDSRKGRAVSGLSMGGFMSMFVATKYPQLISSASFFCPSSGFSIGPKDLQRFTPFQEMGRNYIGLPIRMHIGSNDFLRQHNRELDHAFRTLELFYESWQYGENYFGGFHNAINIKGQFDFHMKHFRMYYPKPEKWYHIDIYPDFKIWGYSLESNRKEVGYTVMDGVSKKGFRLQTKKWLPDGPAVPGLAFQLTTDSLYDPNTLYQFIMLDNKDKKIHRSEIKSDAQGKLHLQWKSDDADIGIYRTGDPGYISMADYTLDKSMPSAWEEVSLTPVLFNKGGEIVDSTQIELIPQDVDVEVLTGKQTIGKIDAGALHQETSFKIRSRNQKLDRAKLKLVVNNRGKSEEFLLEVPFYTPASELTSFKIADGKVLKLEVVGDTLLGKGNGNGSVNPGEWVSIFTQSDHNDSTWYGLKLYTDDPYVDIDRSRLNYFPRNDWSGTLRPTSEVFIKPDCPDGHQISFYGIYEFPKRGNVRRDNQASISFIQETYRVSLVVNVKK